MTDDAAKLFYSPEYHQERIMVGGDFEENALELEARSILKIRRCKNVSKQRIKDSFAEDQRELQKVNVLCFRPCPQHGDQRHPVHAFSCY